MVKKLLRNASAKIRDRTKRIQNPELVFGIVGPIGVDITAVTDSLRRALDDVGYNVPDPIHLTDHMRNDRINVKLDTSTYYDRYMSLIKYANAFRKLAQNKAALAAVAIGQIQRLRQKATGSKQEPALGTAYIIRQFKRPEEVELMRRVYGRKFIQISVFGRAFDRRGVLMNKIRNYDSSPKEDAECERQAIELIDIDHNQKNDDNGQLLSDVFHRGDVFVDGITATKADETITRFVRALFGDTKASPTRDEYGLYMATAASLRSVDLSRQVGAAIFSRRGEIISLGCNEVPKARGGTYWSDDTPPIYRDVELGIDANLERKNEILFDIVSRLSDEGFLSKPLLKMKSNQRRVNAITGSKAVKDSQLMDIIEFGRMTHAEMSAISDAARLGRATEGAVLYCTTFPCHLCAKHIVAAGISRLVFLEPYPKSFSQKLHSDSITFDTEDACRVLFQPFMGISPRRYRDIFEKKKRKDEKGKALAWYEGTPAPLIEDRSAAYLENEAPEVYIALKELRARPVKRTRPR